MTKLDLQDRLSHYQAFARKCQQDANLAALEANLKERRYARASDFVRNLERELKEAQS